MKLFLSIYTTFSFIVLDIKQEEVYVTVGQTYSLVTYETLYTRQCQ